ncbi:hypothetical protein EJ04DRAFT_597174 [Polyplosphaeria fusca]|uniref:Uncharacterized protein n=1 Tax=Polyplosphaeria fusca TaxID=682080 RepID=A0A9P4V1J9_9PLEO|nr:hypothetical protein EJ04DRAFT_597174 [Polyplosphaeria fusca]
MSKRRSRSRLPRLPKPILRVLRYWWCELNKRLSSTITASSSGITSADSSTTDSNVPTRSATVTVTAAPEQHSNDSHIAAIAGGAAGGGAAIMLLLGLLLYYILHAKKSRRRHRDSLDRRQSDLTMRAADKPDMGGSPTASVAPPYASPGPDIYAFNPNSFAQQQQYQQYQHQQYELPVTPSSPNNLSGAYHHHRLSELSGDTAGRTDASSPVPPSPHAHAYSATQSPRSTMAESPNWNRHAWNDLPALDHRS